MALLTIRPSKTDVTVANAIADYASPVPEEVMSALTLAADERVFLALAIAGWMWTRNQCATRRAAGNHALLVAGAATILPHLLKRAVDQTRPDRLTAIGRLHGVPISGKRKDAFPSGHAVHMGRSRRLPACCHLNPGGTRCGLWRSGFLSRELCCWRIGLATSLWAL